MCHEVFAGGSITYAYTTIPTYPRWAGLLASSQADMQTVCTALHAELNHITKAATEVCCGKQRARVLCMPVQVCLHPDFCLDACKISQWSRQIN